MPIAFALGAVGVVFMLAFMPAASVDTIAQNVYEELASITLLTIPLFILKGAAIGKSRAGKDLYDALHTWLNRIPGGLGVAVVLACGLFAAMAGVEPGDLLGHRQLRHSGNAPARLLAGFRRRARGRRRDARHPAAAVDRADPLCGCGRAVARPSVPRRHRPWRAAGRCCSPRYAVLRWRNNDTPPPRRSRRRAARSCARTFHHAREATALPRVLPFLILLTGVMVALYGGIATPSETAGLGARARAAADRASSMAPGGSTT